MALGWSMKKEVATSSFKIRLLLMGLILLKYSKRLREQELQPKSTHTIQVIVV